MLLENNEYSGEKDPSSAPAQHQVTRGWCAVQNGDNYETTKHKWGSHFVRARQTAGEHETLITLCYFRYFDTQSYILKSPDAISGHNLYNNN